MNGEPTSPEDAKLILGLAERIHAQSELLAKRAAKQELIVETTSCMKCGFGFEENNFAVVLLRSSKPEAWHLGCFKPPEDK